jgi:small conductance mechanosensitive channel
MPNLFARLQNFGNFLSQHGTHMALSLAVLIAGMLLVRGIHKGLLKLMPANRFGVILSNTVYVILVMIVTTAAFTEFGAKPINVLRFLSIITLAALGLIIFLRPLFPSMPFKVGNTIKSGDLLGIVEGITFLNTRMRTFDGKTFFVPNRKIIGDIIINYHLTPTRRVEINVGIQYDQDLLKAKQVLEAVMIEDACVETEPSPVVYVLNLADSSVKLGGRCWVENIDWWKTRCDLIEKTKLRFDREGIKFAFPQLELHYNSGHTHVTDSGVCAVAGTTHD